MGWNSTDTAHRQSHPNTMADALKRIRRWQARATARPAGQRQTANLLTSFSMIASLLLFWALAVSM